MNRREFAKKSSIGLLALMSLAMSPVSFLTGCNFGSVFGKILAYVKVGLQAFQAIVSVLNANGISLGGVSAIITLVKAGFADLQTAVNDYNAAPADQKATLLGKVSTALNVLIQDLGQFWNNLSLPDPKLASLISGLLGVIVSTLMAFATQLPAPAQASPRTGKLAGVKATRRSEGQFKKDFNKILADGGYSQFVLR